MKIDAVDPAAAAIIPVADPVPVFEVAVVEKGWRRWQDLVESALFYGLLAFGVLFPLVGTLYAKVFG